MHDSNQMNNTQKLYSCDDSNEHINNIKVFEQFDFISDKNLLYAISSFKAP